MPTKQVALKPPASPKRQADEVLSGDRAGEGAPAAVGARPKSGDVAPAGAPEIQSLIEIIDKLTTREDSEPHWVRRFLTHPLLLVIVGGAISAGLTYYYTDKQKLIEHERSAQQAELTSQRGFIDELNKLRVQKVGEVWEQVDKNEVLIDGMLKKSADRRAPAGQKGQDVDAITNLIREDRVVVNKNRFWLGDEYYQKLQNYLDKNSDTALNVLLAHPDDDLTPLFDERKKAKLDILQLREDMRSEGRRRQ